MANVAGKFVMKLLTVAVGIPVGIASKKAISEVWATTRGGSARRPAEPGVRWRDAIGWAALSAGAMVLADLLTRKGAEEVWRGVMGTEPPATVDKSKLAPKARKAPKAPKAPKAVDA